MKIIKLLFCVVLFAITPLSRAALLNLANSPLFVGGTVPPNVFFQLDDSGSMDWEMLPIPYWEGCAYDSNFTGSYSASTSCGTSWQGEDGMRSYANGGYLHFNYVYNNLDNIYNIYTGMGVGACNYPSFQINAIGACPASGTNIDWRTYSSSLNRIYYNPNITYLPWVYNCTPGTSCNNANFSAALSNPIPGTPGYILSRNLAGSKYEVWVDDHGFSGPRPLRGSALNVSNTPNSTIDLWDSHITVVLNAANAQIYSTVYAPTNAGLNPTQTLQSSLTDLNACYNVLGPAALVQSIFAGTLAYNSQGAPGCLTVTQAQSNFANWYQYNRRRSLSAKGSMAYVINQFPNFRIGANTTSNSLFIQVPPLPATDYLPYHNQLLSQLLGFAWEPLSTPLRSALSRAGNYYFGRIAGTTNPITQSCQQNYTVLITDGYWDASDIVPSAIGDADNDGISNTLADVARYYYITDLSTLANIVAPSPWDPVNWQHMVTFTMGFGLTGNLVAGSNGWPNPPLQTNSNWGNPFIYQASKVDDLWHAAFNSAGNYFSAQNPATAGKSLSTILTNIAQRSASAASAAQNSTVLNIGSVVYQATFNTSNWQGDVLAYPISMTGAISSTPTWSANCMLTGGRCLNPVGRNTAPGPNGRVILTRNWTGENQAIPFRWPANYTSLMSGGVLPENMRSFLAYAPFPANTAVPAQIAANQAYGQALVNFLRGDRTQEIQNGGSYGFRNRSSLLGDIVDSNPLYVPAPYRLYPDNLEAQPYSAFKSANANRIPMVYDGANDGMLHGFNANTGQELIAYIPGAKELYENLPTLSLPTYQHMFFVDGSPVEGDAFINGAWHTLLMGNLRNGGQSIFALDITNPSLFSEGNVNNIFLWEFSDRNDPDIGNVQGNIIIAKVRTALNQSKWAAIFGNGYNNSQPDGNVSTTGKAALFILFIEPGVGGNWVADSSYIKIPVGPANVTTPNGLGPPVAISTNASFLVDYVYAGDLKGNLWKFDLTNISPITWKNAASLLFTSYQNTPGDQPITAPPVVGEGPNGIQSGVIVYFGTGKYLEPVDNSTIAQTTQSFYGIWDQLNGATVSKSALVQQQIILQASPAGGANLFRVVSNNTINWSAPTHVGDPPQNLGWYLNLIVSGGSTNYGERQISQPLLRNNNIIFTTLIPSSDPCVFGGNSWIMEINAFTGGQPTTSPFDVNNDGQFTSSDYIDVGPAGQHLYVPVAGQRSSVGITPTPAVFLSPNKSSEVKVVSGSQGLSSFSESLNSGPSGRQNWRQLY